jgi:pimeloyl-ACP methyl ester carboxylesterase/DNA-binding CsgD family transcriptional regulator
MLLLFFCRWLVRSEAGFQAHQLITPTRVVALYTDGTGASNPEFWCDCTMQDDTANSGGSAPEQRPMRDFFDALTAYAIDPTRWADLLEQFDRLSDRLHSWDPSEFVAELARAESLSWRIKQGGGDPGRAGFAYLLFDAAERVTGSSGNLDTLADYLEVNAAGKVTFTDDHSRASLALARDNLAATARNHSLVSLSHPRRPRHRFGFLIAASEFPPSLARVADGAASALFIAQEDGDSRLRDVIQASFALTTAETDVTVKLAQGMTLKEAAEDLGISINTARNHLQSVFSKSGINRQSDLVLVVTQLSVILAGTESDMIADVREKPLRVPQRHFTILPDGRRIAYRTYGDPRGKPVIYLHETLGCSHLPPGTDHTAERLGLNLIAPERPGFGFSDLDPGFSFPSIAADLDHLLDHLRIVSATLIGFISGGAHALWYANTRPRRVERLVLVASRPPRPMKGRFKHLMPLWTKLTTQPWLMTSFFNILRNRTSPETNARLIKAVYGSVPHDQAYLDANPAVYQHMVTYTGESMTVTASGVASELKCFANVSVEPFRERSLPISAWHGREDNLAGLEDLMHYLNGSNVRWHTFDDAGSLVLFEHWEEILEDASR